MILGELFTFTTPNFFTWKMGIRWYRTQDCCEGHRRPHRKGAVVLIISFGAWTEEGTERCPKDAHRSVTFALEEPGPGLFLQRTASTSQADRAAGAMWPAQAQGGKEKGQQVTQKGGDLSKAPPIAQSGRKCFLRAGLPLRVSLLSGRCAQLGSSPPAHLHRLRWSGTCLPGRALRVHSPPEGREMCTI